MDLPVWLHSRGDILLADVLVSPRASRTRIMGVHGDRLKIQVATPPADDKANHALIVFLAQALDVPRAQLEIVGGHASRRKTVRLNSVPIHKVLLRLSPHRG